MSSKDDKERWEKARAIYTHDALEEPDDELDFPDIRWGELRIYPDEVPPQIRLFDQTASLEFSAEDIVWVVEHEGEVVEYMRPAAFPTLTQFQATLHEIEADYDSSTP